MKRAEEYLSTIIRNRALKKKFLLFIEALLRGESVESAAENASLRKQEIGSALQALRQSLSDEPKRPEYAETGSLSLVVFTDGASRGNPGDAACAAIFYEKNGEELLRRTKILGKTTNNVAEYEGVLLALQIAKELGAKELHLKLDSELVVKQLNGEYKVKNQRLGVLHVEATRLLGAFPKVTISQISRNENRESDKLVNAALDGKV